MEATAISARARSFDPSLSCRVSASLRVLAAACGMAVLQACSGGKGSLPPVASSTAHAPAAGSPAARGRSARDINDQLSAVSAYVLYRFQTGGYDKVTTGTQSEAYANPNDGAIFYIPVNALSGTTELYRLSRSSGAAGPGDHMDSPDPNEGSGVGYHLEGGLGYGWNAGSQPAGTSLMQRIYNPSTGDHATVRNGETMAGYQSDLTLNLYAYPRYGNSGYAAGDSVSGGGVTVGTNAAAGGAIWSWKWQGKEFVDDSDYGRLIQSDFVWGNNPAENPTEAGDGCYDVKPGPGHGSPLISSAVSGSSLTTRAVPLEFSPPSCSSNQLLVYDTTVIGKTLTLNYQNMGPVVQYDSYLSLARALDFTPNSEFPTGYLGPTFNRFYTYDAGSDVLAAAHPSSDNHYPSSCSGRLDWQPDSGYGGVIIADSSNAAMGVYSPTATIAFVPGTPAAPLGGFTTSFQLWDATTCGSTAGPHSKWSAVVTGYNIPAGPSTFRAWVVTGTLSQVRQSMRALQPGTTFPLQAGTPQAAADGASSIRLTSSKSPNGGTGTGLGVEYFFQGSTTPICSWQPVSAPCEATGLAAGTAYAFQALYGDSAGTHVWSSSFGATITGLSPGVPSATANGSGTLVLSSTAASGGSGGGYGAQYYMNGTLAPVCTWTSPGCAVTSLAPNTSYTFQVLYGDGSGTHVWGPSVTATTPAS